MYYQCHKLAITMRNLSRVFPFISAKIFTVKGWQPFFMFYFFIFCFGSKNGWLATSYTTPSLKFAPIKLKLCFNHSCCFSLIFFSHHSRALPLCLVFSREKALQDGLKSAVQVPLNVIKTATKAWDPMMELAKIGNVNSKSDLQVQCMRFAVSISARQSPGKRRRRTQMLDVTLT